VQRPRVVMTPKSLLRHPRAVSTLDDLTSGAFRNLIVSHAGDRTERVLFCTGKIAWELEAALEAADEAAAATALVRVEQLYPFPADQAADLLRRFEGAETVWVQEEPRNMGAWTFIEDRFREALGMEIGYVGRPGRASPAEGYAADHETEQNRIVGEAVTGLVRKAGPAGGSRSGADPA